jgi:hypothetical protein
MLKAIASLGCTVDVLVGSTPDDVGALEVFIDLKAYANCIRHIWVDRVGFEAPVYDLAIMSIPFDGRWRNGVDFQAKEVLDGRTRPDPSTTGLSSWKKHEVMYQLENAFYLGYKGPIPDCSFRIKKS